MLSYMIKSNNSKNYGSWWLDDFNLQHPSNLQSMTVEGKRLLVCLKKKSPWDFWWTRCRGLLQPLLNCDLMICICAFLNMSLIEQQKSTWPCTNWAMNHISLCASLVTKINGDKNTTHQGNPKNVLTMREIPQNYQQHFSMIQHDGRFDEGGPLICQFDTYCIFQQSR